MSDSDKFSARVVSREAVSSYLRMEQPVGCVLITLGRKWNGSLKRYRV